MKDHFPHLFTPQKIGPLTLKNRIVMAPIDTNLAVEKGNVTDALLAFYERRASGGTGMIIVENSQVDFPRGKNTQRQLSIHENKKIGGLKRLAFDMVVWATGRSPNLALAEELKRTPFAGKLHVIGDASSIGKIHDAVYQAYPLVKDL